MATIHKNLIFSLKLMLSAGLVWYAFSKFDTFSSFALLEFLLSYTVFFGVTLLFIQNFLVALRLQKLLLLLKSKCSFLVALDAVIIGTFFSQTFISFIGGDSMRVWRLNTKEISLTTAIKAVFFDRLLGFIGLILIIIPSIFILMNLLRDTYISNILIILVVIAIIGFVIFLLMYKISVSLKRFRIISIISNLSKNAQHIFYYPSYVLILVSNSILIQLLNIIVIFVLASGLSIEISFINCLVLIPPVLFLSMMPISIAGWGVREGAMVISLGLIDIPASQSVTLSVCYGLSLVLVSLPGGFLWIMNRHKILTKDQSVTI